MVILIGGATHTGKTLLAQNLMEETGYPYLSLDHLKMGLIRSGMSGLAPESPDTDIIALVWPITCDMAKTAIENEQNLIIEGCYIPFDWKDDFEDEYRSSVNAVFLAMDESYIRDHFSDIKAHANDIERRLDDSSLNLEKLVRDNAKVIDSCRRSGNLCIVIQGIYPHVANLAQEVLKKISH